MTLFGSKKGYSKSDINFFEEFTASARKQTQVLAVVVFVGIIAIGLCLAVLAYDIFRNLSVQKDIDNLNTTLASDEYAGLELRSQSLQEEINEKNQYYFTLTEMRRIVDSTPSASTEIIDLLGDSIPSDAYIESYTLSGETLTVAGVTFSYYDAVNMCYLLNQSDVFTNYVTPSVARDESMTGTEGIEENPIDIYYDFSITGNLTNNSIISVVHYASTDSGVIALSGISTQSVDYGSSFEIRDITSYTVNGVNYNLDHININDSTVSAADFAAMSNSNCISGIAEGNVEIELYYTVAQATEEGSAE